MAADPASMKPASVKVCPLKVVEKLPNEGSTVSTVALPSPLFDRVPMPKIREPLTVASGAETEGNTMSEPLLSPANKITGFCNCFARLSVVTTHPVGGHV